MIAGLCQKWDAIAFTDEIYEHITYEGAVHVPIATIPGMEDRTITISALSKTYAITGWRVGWAIAPPSLVNGIRKVHDFLAVGAPTPLQHAGATALEPPRLVLRAHVRGVRGAARGHDEDPVGPRVRGAAAQRRVLRDGGISHPGSATTRRPPNSSPARSASRSSPGRPSLRARARPRARPVLVLQGLGDAARGRARAGEAPDLRRPLAGGATPYQSSGTPSRRSAREPGA